MYIPSEFLYKILCSEQIGVFCESNVQGHKSIIAKLPTSTIKAISLGAKVDFYIFTTSNEPHYLALCMKIIDNKNSPLYAVLPQRWWNLNNKFNETFFDTELSLTLFDETDAPVLESKIKIKTNFRNKRIRYILKNTNLITASNYIESNMFIDAISAHLGIDYISNTHYSILSFKFPVEIKCIRSIQTIHNSNQGITSYNVTHDIDGERQERQIYQSLCLMDNSSTTISPLVTIGKKEREFTDILTITNFKQLIAIESKSLKTDENFIDKTTHRTASNIIKHCKKALDQLEGVFKVYKRGEKIYNNSNEILLLDENYLFYGVIIIDEFRPSEKWNEVIKLMMTLSKRYDICFNIITISEFFYTMKLCDFKINLFVELLDKRMQICFNENNIDVQLKNPTLPLMV
ncbi:hypothetical protein [Providencia sp. wls1950]|uniref:hypothetical protein n=1 Tax=Providencia sp. wls1950 TaxID=2675147 RepID=UPI0012B598BF|nr:hypothetical protein [Providencia sp. wls1950]MTB44144.1 hypothetical protein [Providencia sp. wls1950]